MRTWLLLRTLVTSTRSATVMSPMLTATAPTSTLIKPDTSCPTLVAWPDWARTGPAVTASRATPATATHHFGEIFIRYFLLRVGLGTETAKPLGPTSFPEQMPY